MFVHIVAALEQVLDLKLMRFEDVVGRLKAYEERVKKEDKVNDPQENFLYARTEYSNMNNDSSEERGRGSYSRDVYYIPALQSNVISLGQATISGYDISIRGTNEVGRESDEEANPYSILVTVNEISPESEEDKFGSDDTSTLIARLETIRVLIALATEKGWKIHHLDVKTTFLNSNRKKLNSTLKKMGFLQYVHEKAVYRKVPNGEFIIVTIYGDDLFVTRATFLINEFKRRMASQFKMSNLGELTYDLGIEVSQGKDCVEIKQERYAMKILKEAGMEDCNPALCPMEPGLKLSKAKDELEVEVTQYRKMVSCLRYLLHTRPDLTYSVCVVSRYMQSPRESHARAMKQILRLS
nr:hypothetical protein [Tanacetum cinerariifolium]GEW57651.1 hypothetical protein [Tanacetum cinerariifolium]